MRSLTATASFAGMVQPVVVQIATAAPDSFSFRSSGIASPEHTARVHKKGNHI